MTDLEKTKLKTLGFGELWMGLWGTEALSNQYKSEESISRDKLASLRAGIIVKTR